MTTGRSLLDQIPTAAHQNRVAVPLQPQKQGTTSLAAQDLRFASRGYGVGSAHFGPGPTRLSFDLSSHLKAGGGGDRRRGSSVDRADDSLLSMPWR